MIAKETLVPHLVANLIYLSQIYSYYIRGDRSPLNAHFVPNNNRPIKQITLTARGSTLVVRF